MITYIGGLGVIITLIAYIVAFNYFFEKIFKEPIHNNNIFAYIFVPLIITFMSVILLMMPYVIGLEIGI